MLTTFGADAGTLVLNGPVTLTVPALWSTDHATGADGAIALNGTLNGGHDLQVNSGSSSTTFSGAIGGVAPLGDGIGEALTLSSSGLTTFNGTVATASGITAAGPVTFTQDATFGDGDTATTLNGHVTLDGLILTAVDGITFGDELTDLVTLSGGPVTVQTTDSALTFTGPVDGGQALTLNAGTGAITFTSAVGGSAPLASVTIAIAGTVDLLSTLQTVGGFTQTDGSGLTTLYAPITIGGDVSLTNDAITLNGAGTVTSAGGAGAVTLTAQTGAITGGTAAVDILAGSLNATAATGIGSLADPLTTTIGTLSALVTGIGNIVVTETDALTLANVQTTDGLIQILAGGPITINNGSTIANGVGQDVLITATTGNILVGHVQAADDVVLTAQAGGIEEYLPDAAADIVGLDVTLSATAGIGTLGAIETDLDTLTMATGVGGATLHDLGSFVLKAPTVLIPTNSSLHLTADGNLEVDQLTEIRVRGTGTITLIAGASGIGSLIIPADPNVPKNTAGAWLKSDAGDITLHDAGGMDVWRVLSSTGDLDISSTGNLTLRDIISTGGAGTITVHSDGILSHKWTMETVDGAINLTTGALMDVVFIFSTNGSITMVSQQDIIVRDIVSTSGPGSVLMQANDEIDLRETEALVRASGTGFVTLNAGLDGTGELFMKPNSTIITGSGPLTLTSNGIMDLWRISSTSGDISITSGDELFLHEDIVTAGAGSITVAAADSILSHPGVIEITATGTGAISLAAGTDGSGFLTLDPGTRLETISGNITATSPGDTTVARIDSTSGDISLTAGKSLRLKQVVVTDNGGDLALTAGDDLTLESIAVLRALGGGALLAQSGTDGTGLFTMLTGSEIETKGGPITLTSGSDMSLRRVFSDVGSIAITSGKALTINDLISTGGAGTVTITSADLMTVNAPALVRTTGTGALSITAGTDGTGDLLMTGGAISTSTGPISLTSGTVLTLLGVSSTSGPITTTSKALVANGLITTGGTGTVAMSTTDTFNIGPTGHIRTTGTGALTLASATDGLGGLFTMDPLGLVETKTAPLTITSADDLTIGKILSTGGSINLNSLKSITLGNTVFTGLDPVTLLDGTILISANNNIAMLAAGHVKTSGAGNVTITSGTDLTGDIIMNSNALVETITGTLALNSGTDMTVGRALSSTGQIVLTSGSNLTFLNSASTAGAGTLTATADDDITLNTGAGLVRTTGSGALTLTAGADLTGDFFMTADSILTTNTGALLLNAAGDMTFGRLQSTSGPIGLTAGKGMTFLNAISTAGAGTLTATANNTITVTSPAASLIRTTGTGALSFTSGADGTGDFFMNADSVISTNSGPLTLATAGDMTLGRVMSTSGSIQITGGKSLTLLNSVNTGTDGALTATAKDNIIINAGAGLIRTTGTGAVTLNSGIDGSGNFTMLTGQVTSNSGPITLTTPGDMVLKRVASTSGDITIAAAKMLALQDNVTSSGAGGLAISAGTGLTIADNLLIRANGTGNVTLSSAGFGDFTMGTGAAIESGTGKITLSSANHMTLWRLRTTGGGIEADAGQTFTLNNSAVVNGGTGDIDLASFHIMNIVASGLLRTTGTGSITVVGGMSGVTQDLNTGPSSSIEAGGNITLSTSGRMFAHHLISQGGNITLTSGEDLVLPTEVTTFGAGVITATAGQHLQVRRMEAATPITLTAVGMVERLQQQDPLADGTNIIAPSVDITAGTGIGTGIKGILETKVDNLTALVTGTGNILIKEVDAITLDSVHATDGSVVITAGGPITIPNGTVRAAGILHDVTLTTTVGDILVGRVEATNQVNLTSAGAITEFDPDAAPEISALSANFIAGTDIGSALSPLRVSVGSLTASAVGGIYLTETDELLLQSASAGTEVVVTNLTGDLSLGTVTAPGAVSLTATTGSILDIDGDTLNITAGANSLLSAGGVIGLLADPIEVAITNADLSVSAGGQIDGVSVHIAGSITPSNALTVVGTPPGDVIFTQQP